MDTAKVRDIIRGISGYGQHSSISSQAESIGDSRMEPRLPSRPEAPANGGTKPYGENPKNPRTKGGIKSLGDITLKAEAVKAELAALFAKEPDLAEDDYLRQCMVEGETNAYEFMQDALSQVTELEILIEGISQMQRAMGERKARLVKRWESMRSLMLGVLKGSGLPRIELPTATPAIRAGSERVEVADVDLIPDQYLRKEPRLAEIKDALQAGTTVAGCALTTGPDTLAIYNR